MVKEFKRPAARAGRFLRLSERAAQAPVARPEGVREAGRHATVAELSQRLLYRQAIETALPRRGRAHEHARRQHRLDLRLSGFPPWTGGAMQFIYSEGRQLCGHNAARLAENWRALRAERRSARSVSPATRPELARGECAAALATSRSDPGRELLGLASLTCGLAGIGYRTPDTRAALRDLAGELVDGVLLAGVLGGDVLNEGPTTFLSTEWQAMQFFAAS